MPSSVWTGYISFGLISVPIRLFPAARASHVAFHEIHKKCGHRVHQQMYCPYDQEVVPRNEIAMGYEVEKDKYVLVDPAELKKLQPHSSTAMEILQFVISARRAETVDDAQCETVFVPELEQRAVGVDPESQELWIAIGTLLMRFDKDGIRLSSYRTYLPGGARLEPSHILVEPGRLVMGSDPQGIYEFPKPEKLPR
jgi:hypothetical protein